MIREVMKEQIATSRTTKEKLFNIGILLFATKGYSAVGIREICLEAGIKSSSFYNHFKGKSDLLEAILDTFQANFQETSYTEEEIETIISSANIDEFIEYNMQKFAKSYGFPVFHPTLMIVFMERFTHTKAHQILKISPHEKWKEPTERILKGFIGNGTILDCDVEKLTMEYYFALSGIIDTYIQLLVWEENITEASQRIQDHMDYYKELLKK